MSLAQSCLSAVPVLLSLYLGEGLWVQCMDHVFPSEIPLYVSPTHHPCVCNRSRSSCAFCMVSPMCIICCACCLVSGHPFLTMVYSLSHLLALLWFKGWPKRDNNVNY